MSWTPTRTPVSTASSVSSAPRARPDFREASRGVSAAVSAVPSPRSGGRVDGRTDSRGADGAEVAPPDAPGEDEAVFSGGVAAEGFAAVGAGLPAFSVPPPPQAASNRADVRAIAAKVERRVTACSWR
ncbi:hypothetical protein GCM10010405_06970 [Streptomyces macrosporus]|uniref:Uncharacterized protein n=1 Tax=Streptomyces macrosporus TaxID=44032 RepID=A0ABN3JEL1_9ACTN